MAAIAQYNTKLAAIEAMSPFYHTGRPCNKGHISNRYTSNGMCVQCLKNHRVKTGSLVAKARSIAANLSANDMVQAEVWVPRKHSTILHTITRLLNAPNSDQVVTWLNMIDQEPLAYEALAKTFDWRDGIVNAKYDQFPQRHNEAGILLIELNGSWYVGTEVMEVLRGQRAECCRVWGD